MRKQIFALVAISVFISQFRAYALDQGERLNAPPPEAALKLVRSGIEMAERDRIDEAIALFKKAIALAPDYLRAHSEYIKTRVYFQGRYDEVRAEYDDYMKKEPENPIYPMAIFMGQSLAADYNVWLRKTAELAPEWAWGHYAKALLLLGKNKKAAVSELLKSIEKNPTEPAGYLQAIHFQRSYIKRVDDALATAEKMAAQPNLRASALSQQWILRLDKAQWSDEARQGLKKELGQLFATSSDLKVLAAIRSTYLNQLMDTSGADSVEARIRKLDPTWYPERGKTTSLIVTGENGIPRQIVAANRQTAIVNDMEKINPGAAAGERIAQLEALLSIKPKPEIKQVIYERLFRAAAESRDDKAIVKYGETLLALDPTDSAVLAKLALALADQKALQKALRYAQQAATATAESVPPQRPINTDAAQFKGFFSEKAQQENYKQQRALALDAVGWTLYRTGDYVKAEAALRQSVESQWSERNLNHLAEVLQKRGHADEAQRISAEAKKVLIDSIKRRFTDTPAKDFTVEDIEGRNYKLSDLRGKVVLINFWGTWCVPCRREVPLLNEMYEKYKSQGFEILAISVGDDKKAVAPFARQNRMNFPVVFANGGEALYKVNGFPTNIFIDRQGNIRYRQEGLSTDERVLEIVITELLK